MTNDVNKDEDSEFLNIKDQIVKQFFTEYDPKILVTILNTLGCPDLKSCTALISISSIDYTVNSGLFVKRYINKKLGIENKQLIESYDLTISNNSTSKAEVNTQLQYLNVDQTYEVNISKTGYIHGTTSIPFTSNTAMKFTFDKNSTITSNLVQPLTVYALEQKVTLEANTKMNVTYNFYQYEEYANYFIDLDILESSVIKHPAVGENSVVYIASTPLYTFLQTHQAFIQTIKYTNPIGIKILQVGDRFKLKNVPAIEKIINYSVELEYGKPENITTTFA